MLISDPPEGLQRYLNALKSFCIDKDLSVNFEKMKVMVLNTIPMWATRSELEVFLGEEKVPYIESYTYLDVPITRPLFSK